MAIRYSEIIMGKGGPGPAPEQGAGVAYTYTPTQPIEFIKLTTVITPFGAWGEIMNEEDVVFPLQPMAEKPGSIVDDTASIGARLRQIKNEEENMKLMIELHGAEAMRKLFEPYRPHEEAKAAPRKTIAESWDDNPPWSPGQR